MRVVFTSTSGLGHLLPTLSLAGAVAAVGHDVRLASAPEHAARISAAGIGFVALPQPTEQQYADVRARLPDESEAVGAFYGRLRPLTARAALEAELATRPADLIVAEGAEQAGPLTAERAGIPIVRVQPSMSHGGAWERLLAPILACTRAELDLPIDHALERLMAIPQISYFPAELDSNPVQSDVLRVRRPGLPQPGTRREKLIYVTFGTEVSKTPMFADTVGAAISAARRTRHAVLVALGGGDPGAIDDLTGIEVRSWVDQAEVLPRAALMISHGGAGTTLDALAAGTPAVTVPFFADQPFNAALLAEVGVGRHVPPGQGLADRIFSALADILSERPAECDRIAAAISDLPDISAAFDLLERTAASGLRAGAKLASP